ncbi:MAG: hypothetical protein HUU27_01495 [Phycisphaerae bacterium]|nr:hypothetical protein [Phycisphaerae bacterium]
MTLQERPRARLPRQLNVRRHVRGARLALGVVDDPRRRREPRQGRKRSLPARRREVHASLELEFDRLAAGGVRPGDPPDADRARLSVNGLHIDRLAVDDDLGLALAELAHDDGAGADLGHFAAGRDARPQRGSVQHHRPAHQPGGLVRRQLAVAIAIRMRELREHARGVQHRPGDDVRVALFGRDDAVAVRVGGRKALCKIRRFLVGHDGHGAGRALDPVALDLDLDRQAKRKRSQPEHGHRQGRGLDDEVLVHAIDARGVDDDRLDALLRGGGVLGGGLVRGAGAGQNEPGPPHQEGAHRRSDPARGAGVARIQYHFDSPFNQRRVSGHGGRSEAGPARTRRLRRAQQAAGVLTRREAAVTKGPFVTGALPRPVNPPIHPRHHRPEEEQGPRQPLHVSHKQVAAADVSDLVQHRRLKLSRAIELSPRQHQHRPPHAEDARRGRRVADDGSRCAHADTPAVSHLDALGRVFRVVADNGPGGQYVTQTALDIEGNPQVITDPRGNQAMVHRFGMGGQVLYQRSNDAGERWMLAGATGQLLRAWNGRGFTYRCSYDELRRPTHRYVQPTVGAERLAQRVVYGEGHPQAIALNLRGRPYEAYDGAGVLRSQGYDFKGNLLQSSRRLRGDVHADADWSTLAALTDVAAIAAAADPLLEAESFASQTAYDALNRPASLTTPDASEIKPTYNEAGLLERVEARIRDAAGWTTFVDDIDYDTKGRRERIDHGNGTSTAYTYDPLTFRLTRLKTTRNTDSAVLQNLTYTYDPVGNITEIGDSAQQTVFFNNAVVTPATRYVYDAIYRLIEATGREHAGGIADVQRDQNDLPIQTLPHPNDAQALRTYTEEYVYDAVGNILQMIHQAGAGSWTRRYAYEAASNRLLSTSLPGDPVSGPYGAAYDHDAHGNMIAMPHIAAITWDEDDRMRTTDLGGGGVVYYAYDAAGQRVRKVWEHSGLIEERIYLGSYEVYRKRDVTGLLLERQTLHVMDDARRVAMVETKTVDASGPFTVTPRVRYQLDNHLGSACLEVDGAGLVISYEEYHPYGTTAYWSASSAAEVSRRRYRYTGKEKDEETGLYYHGARYYAPWLGRWTSADPAGMVDGSGLYTYAMDNPAGLRDPSGRESDADERIAQMTDVQLHRHLKGLSPEARAAFTASATGKFRERASATLDLGKLESVRTGVTTVEHVRPHPPETAEQSAGAANESADTPEEYYSQSEYRGMILAGEALTEGTTGILNFLYAEANSRPDAGVEPTELPPGGDTWEAGGEGGLLSDPAMRTATGLAVDTSIGLAVVNAIQAGEVAAARSAAPAQVGATPAAGRSAPFNPSNSRTNCVNGVCAFIESVQSGTLVTADANVAKNLGSIATVNNQIAARTGVRIGSPQQSTLETARKTQFFLVYPGRSQTEANHIMIGIGRREGGARLYDPQSGAKFADSNNFGPFVAFPIIW